LGKCLNNGVFISKKNTDVLKYLIYNIKTQCKYIESKEKCIRKTTGPLFTTKYINMYMKKNPDKILILSNENRSSKKLDIIKYDRVSPPSTSTLKRSTDIKLNLSKLLDKKAYEVLTSVSGSNIKHNCTHINKHGVVINTESIYLFLFD
jgi:hypothetical protein